MVNTKTIHMIDHDKDTTGCGRVYTGVEDNLASIYSLASLHKVSQRSQDLITGKIMKRQMLGDAFTAITYRGDSHVTDNEIK